MSRGTKGTAGISAQRVQYNSAGVATLSAGERGPASPRPTTTPSSSAPTCASSIAGATTSRCSAPSTTSRTCRRPAALFRRVYRGGIRWNYEHPIRAPGRKVRRPHRDARDGSDAVPSAPQGPGTVYPASRNLRPAPQAAGLFSAAAPAFPAVLCAPAVSLAPDNSSAEGPARLRMCIINFRTGALHLRLTFTGPR